MLTSVHVIGGGKSLLSKTQNHKFIADHYPQRGSVAWKGLWLFPGPSKIWKGSPSISKALFPVLTWIMSQFHHWLIWTSCFWDFSLQLLPMLHLWDYTRLGNRKPCLWGKKRGPVKSSVLAPWPSGKTVKERKVGSGFSLTTIQNAAGRLRQGLSELRRIGLPVFTSPCSKNKHPFLKRCFH